MNTPFDYGAEQLKNADNELVLLRVVAEETDDSFTHGALSVLEQAKLEQYFELCSLVDTNPDIVRFYGRALERAEILQNVSQQEALQSLEGRSEIALGRLAAQSTIDIQNYEAFFLLFAPHEPVFQSYLHRKVQGLNPGSVIEGEAICTDDHDEQVGSFDVEHQTTGSDMGISQEESDGLQAKPSMDKSAHEPSDATEVADTRKESVTSEVIINGQPTKLSDVEMLVIKVAIYNGKTDLKTGMFIDREDFIEYINRITGRTITRSGYSQRFNGIIDDLNDRYPDLFLRTGIKGGARLHLNPDYTVLYTEKPTTTVDTDETPEDDQVALDADISEEVAVEPDLKKSPQTQQQPEAKPKVKRISKRHKLLKDGFMVDGIIQPYTDAEQVVVQALTSAPRKQPISEQQLLNTLKEAGIAVGSIDDVRTVLSDVQSKLPDGWMIKVSDNGGSNRGWRFGQGIRVIKQR